VVMKLGASAEGRAAALAHTGALAGAMEAFDAVAGAAGALRVRTVDDVVEAVEYILHAPHLPSLSRMRGREEVGDVRLGAITFSGALRGLLLDAAAAHGLAFAALADATSQRLAAVLGVGTIIGNPLDSGFTGLTNREAYVKCVEAMLDDPGIDADVPFAQRRSLIELTASACRWPVGDPSHPDFFFCGAEALQGKPYCAAHGARARRSADDVLQGGGSARRRTMRRTRSLEGAAKFGGKGTNECERSEEGR